MLKPDAVHRRLTGTILKRFEDRGYKLIALKFLQPSKELLTEHYKDLSSKGFFPGLISYMLSGPVVATVWEGKDGTTLTYLLIAVKTGRVMLGETNPLNSRPGSIRGDFTIDVGRNIIHGSDSVEAANAEIALWFRPEEVVSWEINDHKWIYE